MNETGQKIKQLRLSRNWTLQDLANAIGCRHRQTVHYWESGKNNPSSQTISKLSKAFGVSQSYFFD